MSQVYIRRLRAIADELEAARLALVYVDRHWQKNNLFVEIEELSRRDFQRAARNIEATYCIRLYAEFEGILKDHLAQNHALLHLPAKPKVDQLISAVTRAEAILLDPIFRVKLEQVRDWRNGIAHSGNRSVQPLSFSQMLARLNMFLARLPEPRT